MRAAYVESLGEASTIRVGELPDPVPGPRDVIVRGEFSAVDGVDTFLRSGRWRSPVRFPLVLGRDVVGTVVAAGADVDDVGIGQRVWTNSAGYENRPGAAAELVAIDRDRLYPVPEGADSAAFVASVHPAATAFGILGGRARLAPGETVAVYGANGAVGSCLVQVAAGSGARVVAMARSEAAVERLRELGADTVIVCEADGVPDAIENTGADIFVDPTGRVDLAAASARVNKRGRIVVIATRSTVALPLWTFYTREVQLLGFVVSAMTAGELAAAASSINACYPTRPVEVPVGVVLPLDEAAVAHRRVETGDLPRMPDGTTGRILLSI